METPQIPGFSSLQAVGKGPCGTVYQGTDSEGQLCAIKVLRTLAVNQVLLKELARRRGKTGIAGVMVGLKEASLEGRPAFLVRTWEESSLQEKFFEFMEGEKAWPFLVRLAEGLAELHRNRIAHGNLKPSNIMLTAEGAPLLTDVGLGVMPGVHLEGFSDALLYAPTEQLRHPEGFMEEEGYRWDVHAFGVLAFRLLNGGKFPRADAVFQKVVPDSESREMPDVDADLEGVAVALEANPLSAWALPTEDEAEKERRHVVEHCLALNAMERPPDMRQVYRRLAGIDERLRATAALQEAQKGHQDAEKACGRWRKGAGVLAAAGLLAAGGLWGWREVSVKQLRELAETNEQAWVEAEEREKAVIAEFTEVRSRLEGELSAERKTLGETQKRLTASQAELATKLRGIQETNVLLAEWLLEEGVPGLPPLIERPGRLALLTEKLERRREELLEIPGLEKEAAHLRLILAELRLAMGDVERGREDLEALVGAPESDLPPESMMRARLRSLLLASEIEIENEAEAKRLEEDVAILEKELAKAFGENRAGLGRAEAALMVVRGRVALAEDNPAGALTAFYSALQKYQELSRSFPESPAIYFTLGRGYLEAARVAEGAGAADNAATLRKYAARQFLKLAEKTGETTPETEYQIASASAAEAVAKWQAGDTMTASVMAEKGLGKLAALAVKMPGDSRVIADLAEQEGIVATALRDEGKAEAALKLLRQALARLKPIVQRKTGDLELRYLLSSLQWQLCGLLGQMGAGDEELELGLEARENLQGILAAGKMAPHPYLVRKSLAYLTGDLGHAADLHGRKALALELVRESVDQWKNLNEQKDSAENQEGLSWAEQRLREMEN